MECKYCGRRCRRAGRQKNGIQRYFCQGCQKYQQKIYRYRAYNGTIGQDIRSLSCESVGIRGIARVLGIAKGTVSSRIQLLARNYRYSSCKDLQATFEVDGLWTYIGRKANEYWIAYALDRKTRQVIDFVIGKRTKVTLKQLIDRLLLLEPSVIRTDKLTIYQRLIPSHMHRAGAYLINRIERNNLTIRTHLKRLSRKTTCFTRSIIMLESCLKLYFWR